MKKTLLALLASALIAGCATRAAAPTVYDFGPLRSNSADPALTLPAISIAEISAPAWLDSPLMYYRLAYADEQQPRPYATSQWTMPPAQLFSQRLKARIAQAGGVVLSSADGATSLPQLRIDLDEVSQTFASPTHSSARIALRASVLNGRTLLAQKTFSQQAPAPSADAPGGAKAMVSASDALISAMLAWLATLPTTK